MNFFCKSLSILLSQSLFHLWNNLVLVDNLPLNSLTYKTKVRNNGCQSHFFLLLKCSVSRYILILLIWWTLFFEHFFRIMKGYERRGVSFNKISNSFLKPLEKQYEVYQNTIVPGRRLQPCFSLECFSYKEKLMKVKQRNDV